MRISSYIRIALLVALVIIGVIAYKHTRANKPNQISIAAVAMYVSPAKDYTAVTVTSTSYNGKKLTTNATLYHSLSMERIEYCCPGGKSAWSLTRDGKSYAYTPKDGKLLISEQSNLVSDSEKAELLKANYTADDTGRENVAGRSCWVFAIKSSLSGRQVRKIWVDGNFVILKSIDYSPNGEEHSSMEVKKLDYGANIPPKTFDIPADKSIVPIKVCESANSPAIFNKLDFKVEIPKYIPEGYKLEGYHIFNCQCNCGHRAAQITYTDGLNMISVFETSKNTTCGLCCSKSGGKSCSVETCGMAQLGQMSCPGKTVVIVGDLPAEEIREIAKSVE